MHPNASDPKRLRVYVWGWASGAIDEEGMRQDSAVEIPRKSGGQCE